MAGKGLLILLLVSKPALGRIDRQHVVSKYNLIDNKTMEISPSMWITQACRYFLLSSSQRIMCLQSFLPFNTLSSSAWHDDSLPTDGYSLSILCERNKRSAISIKIVRESRTITV